MSNKISNFLELVDLAATPSNPSSGVRRVYAKSDNKVYSLDSTGLESNLIQQKKIVQLATLQTTASTTFINLPTMNFNVISGKIYKITAMYSVQSSVTTTGVGLGVYLSGGGVGTVIGYANGDVGQGTLATTLRIPIRFISTALGSVGSNILTTGVNPINSPHIINFDLIFTCTTSGIFNFCYRSETAANITVNAGSTIIYEILN